MADEDVDEEILDDEAEVAGPEDLEEGELEELAVDDELLVDEDVDEPVVADDVAADEEEIVVVEEAPAEPAAAATTTDEEDEEDEDEDEDDVEASLDVILKEKLVVADEEADEEAPDQDDRMESTVNRVLPKQPDEFVCSSCFLVKHPSQLADARSMRCRDCV